MMLVLDNDPAFRKDMPKGAQGRVEAADLRECDGFVLVRLDYIHDGVPVTVVDYINPNSIAVQGAREDPSGDTVVEIPDEVRTQVSTELSLEIVDDWASLLNDNGPSANLMFLKSRALLSLVS